MSTTLVLQNTITWTQTLLKNAPLMVNGQEPALSFANWILQRIMGPPFSWRFNRGTFNFPITQAGGTDYVVIISDLGQIETQWLQDAGNNVFQLNGETSLPKSQSVTRPQTFSPQYDDNAGNITFRMKSIPDKAYTVFCDYQRKPQLMTSAASTWGQVPDEFSYIFNAGFLSLAMMLVNDSRFPIWEQYFISALLGAQEGLDEQSISIFLRDWMNTLKSISMSQAGTTAGITGRGK